MKSIADKVSGIFDKVGDMSLNDFKSYITNCRHFKCINNKSEYVFDDESKIIIFNKEVISLK